MAEKDIHILDLEQDLSHESFYFRGSYIYPLIKQELLRSHFQEYEKQYLDDKNSMGEKFRKLLSVFRNSLHFFTQSRLKPYDVLFVDSSSSRRFIENRKAYSVYCDFLMGKLSASRALLLELPSRSTVRPSEIATSNIYYPDMAFFRIYIKSFFVRSRFKETESIINELNRYNINLGYRKVNKLLKRFYLYSKWFEKVLLKINPGHVFLVCSYSYLQMALIGASKKMNIPVIELQHGHITKQHFGYIYRHLENRDLIPDYFFAYGSYFKNLLEENSVLFEPRAVFSTGNMFLDKLAHSGISDTGKLLGRAGHRKIVFFSSQITTRSVLREKARYLCDNFAEELFIVYKPHPGEIDASRYYKQLIADNNCELLLSNRYNAIDLLKIADIHVTVYSTVFMEAYYLKVPTIFYFVEPFMENVQEFVDDTFLFLCRSSQELIDMIRKHGEKKQNKPGSELEFYKLEPWTSFCTAMRSIGPGGDKMLCPEEQTQASKD